MQERRLRVPRHEFASSHPRSDAAEPLGGCGVTDRRGDAETRRHRVTADATPVGPAIRPAQWRERRPSFTSRSPIPTACDGARRSLHAARSAPPAWRSVRPPCLRVFVSIRVLRLLRNLTIAAASPHQSGTAHRA
jgi:hypothetical protein